MLKRYKMDSKDPLTITVSLFPSEEGNIYTSKDVDDLLCRMTEKYKKLRHKYKNLITEIESLSGIYDEMNKKIEEKLYGPK